MSQNKEDKGFLYYASGKSWQCEAVISAKSVKAVMPDAIIAIVSETDMPKDIFDIQIHPPEQMHVKQLKMWTLSNTPFYKTLYLDTDTYITDPVYELFPLLDRFDLAATVTPYWTIEHMSEGGKVNDDGISVAFPKLNTGVVLYKFGDNTDNFFHAWAARHAATGYGQDQGPFRYTLYHSDLVFCVLPQAYNYRLNYPGGIGGKVKIFHGHMDDIERISLKINQTGKWRTTIPYKHTRFVLYNKKRPLLWWFI